MGGGHASPGWGRRRGAEGERGWEWKCAYHRRRGLQNDGPGMVPHGCPGGRHCPPCQPPAEPRVPGRPCLLFTVIPFSPPPPPPAPAAGSPGSQVAARVPSLGSPYCVPTSCSSSFLDAGKPTGCLPWAPLTPVGPPHSFVSLFGFSLLSPLLPSPPCPAQDLAGTEING